MPPKNEQDGQESRSFIEEARRAQIVAATIDTIAEVGYTRTSMERIAAKAGISRGLISYHFTSKADLISQAFTTIYIDGGTFMGPRVEAETTATGKLHTYIRANLEYMRAHPERMVALVAIFAGGGLTHVPDGDPDKGDQNMLAPLLSFFHEGQQTGEFRDFDPEVMARIVRAAIDTVPNLLSTNPNLDIELYSREIITAIDKATRNPDTKDAT